MMIISDIYYLRNSLKDLLLARSVRRGDFVLASGRRSAFYIDARLTTMSGDGLAVIGGLGLDRLAVRGWTPRAVGGLTLGADPVAYALALTARRPRVALRLLNACAAGTTKPPHSSSASKTSKRSSEVTAVAGRSPPGCWCSAYSAG